MGLVKISGPIFVVFSVAQPFVAQSLPPTTSHLRRPPITPDRNLSPILSDFAHFSNREFAAGNGLRRLAAGWEKAKASFSLAAVCSGSRTLPYAESNQARKRTRF